MYTATLKASLVFPGFCCILLRRGCEARNEAKKLKEKVTVAGSRVGTVECRDFGKGAGGKMKDVIYAVYGNSCLLA